MAFTRQADSRMVTGLFPDRESAERAYRDTSTRGYRDDDVNVVMSDDTRKTHFSSTDGRQTELGTKAAEGAGIGGAIGGSLGAIAAAIATLRSPDFRHRAALGRSPYGEAGASGMIVAELERHSLAGLLKKRFHDLPSSEVAA